MPNSYLAPNQVGTVQFVFSDIQYREGLLRYTFWRNFNGAFNDPFEKKPGTPILKTSTDLTVNVNGRILLKKGTWDREIERLFTEITFHEWDLTLYDTASLGDIDSLGSPNWYGGHPEIDLGVGVNERLFTKFIKPFENTQVYLLVERWENGDTQYRSMFTGQLQNAVSGHDLRWYTESGGANPYLDQIANKATDAERTWDLKFVQVTLTGLGKTSITPDIKNTSNDPLLGSSYFMPFFCPDSTLSAYSTVPYDTDSSGMQVVQGVSNVTYVTFGPVTHSALWRRHINVRLWLQYVLDYQFGKGNWTMEADDSPFTFYYGRMGGPGANNAGTIQVDPTFKRTVNIASDDPTKWILIPQCVFGLYKLLNTVGASYPVPYLTSGYTDRFKSVFDGIMDLCLFLGYVLKTDMDYSGAVPKAHLKFKDRTKTEPNVFSTIVPSSAEPIAFPESENGVSVSRLSSFRNARSDDSWFDDWFAAKLSNGTLTQLCEKSTDNVTVRMANPYVIPQTAQNPAKIESTFCFGGDQNWLENTVSTQQINWYSIGQPYANVGTGDPQTEAWPMLTPLVLDTMGGIIDALPMGQVGALFAPIMRASFEYTDSSGVTHEVICDAARQLHARFYALFFVKSDLKYIQNFPTTSGFTDQTPNSSTFGERGGRFIDILYQHTIFDELNYAKKITVSFDDVTTIIESMATVRYNRNFESSGGLVWSDSSEPPGIVPGIPPDTGGGPTPGGGGITGP